MNEPLKLKPLKLLCIDDEIGILKSLMRLLRNESFDVLVASEGAEALSILAANEIQVVLVDQRMPDIDGLKLLKKIKAQYPSIVAIVLSGLVDLEYILSAINRGEVERFLAKPWNDEELKTVIRQCFYYFDLAKKNTQLNQLVNQQKNQLDNMKNLLDK